MIDGVASQSRLPVRFGAVAQASGELPAINVAWLNRLTQNPLDKAAFLMTDTVRVTENQRQARTKVRKRLKPHDEFSAFLADSMADYFPGVAAFVRELRQDLVAAGKIPTFVTWMSPKKYGLDQAHQRLTPEQANERLKAIRTAVGLWTKPFKNQWDQLLAPTAQS